MTTSSKAYLKKWVWIFIFLPAEVPVTARVNLQPAEHLKNVPFSFYGFKPPQAQAQAGEGAGVKPAPKPSLDRWGCGQKISSRSV